MSRLKTDLCVIGAGSGGLSVAAGASQMGADVVLLEGGEMGGDCLNYGCVPSKALLAAGKRAHAMLGGRPFGVTPVVPEVSYSGAMEHVRNTIRSIAPHDSQERFESLGVRVVRAFGCFLSPHEVQAGDVIIEARRIVIATGSSPFIPPVPGLADTPFLTNETIFDLQDRPQHLIILGGGPVGMEMAQAHVRLGCRVTVIEADTVLNRDDPEFAVLLRDRLKSEGVEIHENTSAERVDCVDGSFVVEASSQTISGTHLLVAAGRVPNIARLNLDIAGVDHDRRGIQVNAGLRTTNRRVYAIGDVAGQMQFTHVAGYHAGVIARSILFGLPARAKTNHLPATIYTDPELAQIGLSEANAGQKYGERLEVVRVPMDGNDRAVAENHTTGMIKVLVHRGRPVGVSILGAQAGELIGVWALMMANGLKLKSLANTVLPYPTLGEINKRAVGAYFSPRLFDSPMVKKVVKFVQRHIP